MCWTNVNLDRMKCSFVCWYRKDNVIFVVIYNYIYSIAPTTLLCFVFAFCLNYCKRSECAGLWSKNRRSEPAQRWRHRKCLAKACSTGLKRANTQHIWSWVMCSCLHASVNTLSTHCVVLFGLQATYIYIYTYINKYICIYIHKYIYTYIHT